MLDYTDDQLQAAAQRTANVFAQLANELFGCDIPIPVPMNFGLCEIDPKCAGRAAPSMEISINMILFRDYVKDMLNVTIPHELAHLVQFKKFDFRGLTTQDHGVEWQEVMRRLGKDPAKYHNMDVTKAVEWYKQFKKEQKAAQKRAEKEALREGYDE